MEELEKEILELIRSDKSNEEIKESLSHYHDLDIAEVIPSLSTEERARLYEILGDQETSDVLSYVDTEDIEEIFDELSDEKVADLVENMDSDDAVDFLEELDEEDRDTILDLMESEAAFDARLILSYDKDEIGSRMTTNFITITKDDTIRKAMKSLITQASENDNISTLFVTEENGSLYGAIDLKDLIIARENDDLEKIIQKNYPYVLDTQIVADIINDLKDYAEEIIPVLDASNKLIGVITSSDIVEAVNDELSEDYSKFAGLTSQEDLNESVFTSMKKRIPWLFLLLFLGLGISLLISRFDTVIAILPTVVFFQSLILDMAGNSGTQSLAVTIRVLSDEEVDKAKLRRLLFKEVRVGLCNGLVLSILAYAVVLLFMVVTRTSLSPDLVFNYADAFKVGGVVAIALLTAMVLSSAIGSLTPIFFKKVGVDPAVASGPLITTLNDIIAIVCYYGLAFIMFSALL